MRLLVGYTHENGSRAHIIIIISRSRLGPLRPPSTVDGPHMKSLKMSKVQYMARAHMDW